MRRTTFAMVKAASTTSTIMLSRIGKLTKVLTTEKTRDATITFISVLDAPGVFQVYPTGAFLTMTLFAMSNAMASVDRIRVMIVRTFMRCLKWSDAAVRLSSLLPIRGVLSSTLARREVDSAIQWLRWVESFGMVGA